MKQTICLNMIVKNEASVIERCLASVKPLIDTWVIVDTGSTDGTQEIIRDYLKGIPGELHERPWVDFSANRNQARTLALGKSDYLMIIDADDELEFSPQFSLPLLDKTFYFVQQKKKGQLDFNPWVLLVFNRDEWSWEGILHEQIKFAQKTAIGSFLPHVTNLYHQDGHRNRNVMQKYENDIALLKCGLEKEPNNSVYQFYLAQSYFWMQKYEQAVEAYAIRAEMRGDQHETYHSLCQTFALQKQLCRKSSLSLLKRAEELYPNRIEALYYRACDLEDEGDFDTVYKLAKQALEMPLLPYFPFQQMWIRECGLFLLLGKSAFKIKRYGESYKAYRKTLSHPDLPPEVGSKIRAFLQGNAFLYNTYL